MLRNLTLNTPVCSNFLKAEYCSLIRPKNIKYQRDLYPKMKGQYQHWKPPVYESALVPILERGPDFTFQDGRKPLVTSKFQLERLVKQADLGKKIVQYLADLKEIEKLHEEEMALSVKDRQIEIEKWTPNSKELKEIF